MPAFSKSRDTAYNASQALREIERVSQELSAQQQTIQQTRRIIQALWEIVKKETGRTDDQLSELVHEMEARAASTSRQAELCPCCNRALQERSKACIYCGTIAPQRRLF